MPLKDRLKTQAESRFADWIINGVAAVGVFFVVLFADTFLPASALRQIDPTTLSRAMVGLVVGFLLLAGWIVLLKRKPPTAPVAESLYHFDQHEGVYRLPESELVYCAKCDDRPPLQVKDNGWSCRKCESRYNSVAYKEAKRRADAEEAAEVERAMEEWKSRRI